MFTCFHSGVNTFITCFKVLDIYLESYSIKSNRSESSYLGVEKCPSKRVSWGFSSSNAEAAQSSQRISSCDQAAALNASAPETPPWLILFVFVPYCPDPPVGLYGFFSLWGQDRGHCPENQTREESEDIRFIDLIKNFSKCCGLHPKWRLFLCLLSRMFHTGVLEF